MIGCCSGDVQARKGALVSFNRVVNVVNVALEQKGIRVGKDLMKRRSR